MAAGARSATANPRLSRYTTKFPLLLLALILVVLLIRQFHLNHDAPKTTRRLVRHGQAPAFDIQPDLQDNPRPWFFFFAPRHSPKPEYHFPKIILQTVKNKSSIPCETLSHIQSWRDMNPGYTHMLFDNEDIAAFMHKYHARWLPTFNKLRSAVERADMWRYLALYTYGGVYADSDVRCMMPIDRWNEEHQHDAKVLVGLEGVNEKWHRGSQFQQWSIAAMPNHTLLGAMPRYIATYLEQHPYPEARARRSTEDNQQVLQRTGPIRWTDAVLDYLQQLDAVPPKPQMVEGVKAADIRIMPVENMALGWGEPCSEVAKKTQRSYLCHQYHGSWKVGYYFRKDLNMGCPTPAALLEPITV